MSGLVWKRKRILIWGKTRPEMSSTYREIVCTGGVFEDRPGLIRLYPVPLRFMDDERIFRKYQWISATVARTPSDRRPESYKIRPDDIDVHETIEADGDDWADRREWIVRPEHVVESVEDLQAQQQASYRSLGLLRPAEVLEVVSKPFSAQERDAFWTRYKERTAQMELPIDPASGREVKPLTPPDYRFQIRFRCDDSRCQGHTFSVLDWELDALYSRQRTKSGRAPEQAASDVVSRIERMCSPERDLRFFLGNIANHPQVFTIVGLWPPKKRIQSRLPYSDG